MLELRMVSIFQSFYFLAFCFHQEEFETLGCCCWNYKGCLHSSQGYHPQPLLNWCKVVYNSKYVGPTVAKWSHIPHCQLGPVVCLNQGGTILARCCPCSFQTGLNGVGLGEHRQHKVPPRHCLHVLCTRWKKMPKCYSSAICPIFSFLCTILKYKLWAEYWTENLRYLATWVLKLIYFSNHGDCY